MTLKYVKLANNTINYSSIGPCKNSPSKMDPPGHRNSSFFELIILPADNQSTTVCGQGLLLNSCLLTGGRRQGGSLKIHGSKMGDWTWPQVGATVGDIHKKGPEWSRIPTLRSKRYP